MGVLECLIFAFWFIIVRPYPLLSSAPEISKHVTQNNVIIRDAGFSCDCARYLMTLILRKPAILDQASFDHVKLRPTSFLALRIL